MFSVSQCKLPPSMKKLLIPILLCQAALGLGAAENNGQLSPPTVVERGAVVE